MPSLERSVRIDAPTAIVWAVVADVERWPEWTPSVKRLDLAGEVLNATSRARIRLRGSVIAVTWRVTEFSPPRSFAWESTIVPGANVIATHRLAADGDGTLVTLGIAFRGPLAGLVGALLMPISRRNLEDEAAGLRRACEARAASGAAR